MLMGGLLAVLASSAVSHGDPGAQLTRGPFLQLGGEDTMTVVWHTNVLSEGQVEFGASELLGESASSGPVPSTVHVVTLAGLEPDTEYHYRVVCGEQVLASERTFETFPLTSSSVPFRVVVWGDSGDNSGFQFEMIPRIEALEADFAIHTGDVDYIHDYDRSYFQPYADFISRTLLFSAFGNHDEFNDNDYDEAFYLPSNNPAGTERYYSIDHGNAHLIFLDTNQGFEVGSSQYDWFRQDISASTAFWNIVIHHHTPFTTGHIHDDDRENVPIRRALTPVYDCERVDLVLSGHTHAYERMYPILDETIVDRASDPDYVDPCGRIFITTGGGGNVFLHQRNVNHPNNAFVARYESTHHVTVLEFEGDRIHGRAIGVGGNEIDAFSLTKSPQGESRCLRDCNGNDADDVCELLDRTSHDCDKSGVPDECETDCNGNAVNDGCDMTREMQFGEKVLFPGGDNAAAVSAADFDGDGHTDLVTANADGDNVSIFFGNGRGGFSQPTEIFVGDRPFQVAVGDLDGDGIVDLVTANLSDQELAVLLGRGDGQFQAPRTIEVLDGPRGLVVGLLDEDDVLDIATAERSQVWVFGGNGDGTFEVLDKIRTVDNIGGLKAADLDGNLVPDLVALGERGIGVLTGLGGGDWRWTRDIAALFPRDIAVADMDSDGAQDLLILLGSGAVLRPGDGIGGFEESLIVFSSPSRFEVVDVRDVDSDGLNDVIVTGDLTRVFRGLGDRAFDLGTQIGSERGGVDIWTGDLNDDGLAEVVVSSRFDRLTVFENETRVPVSHDCNANGVPDECDVVNEPDIDVNSDGIPDECETLFLRGDAEADGRLTITDVLRVLLGLFRVGFPSECEDASDVDDSGAVDISDGVVFLQFLFGEGPRPPMPYPSCGLDPSPDNLGCEDSPLCEADFGG
jgi:hypothetical protein